MKAIKNFFVSIWDFIVGLFNKGWFKVSDVQKIEAFVKKYVPNLTDKKLVKFIDCIVENSDKNSDG